MHVAPLQSSSQAAAPSPASMSTEQQARNMDLVNAVHAVNAAELYGEGSELALVLDRHRKRALVRLVDRKTSQVIREVPADQVLSLADSLGRCGANYSPGDDR